MEKKLFCLNEDGVAEWIVAKNDVQALEYASSLWGITTVLEYFEEYLKQNPDSNYSEFLDSFVKEEDKNKVFTLHECGKNCDETATKTVKEFLDEIEEVPSYFAHGDY